MRRRRGGRLLPLIDAVNIDLKGFTEALVPKALGGDLETVKTLHHAGGGMRCHVEVTTLIVPG